MNKLLVLFATLLNLHTASSAENSQLNSIDMAIKASSNKPVDQTVIQIAQLLAKGNVVIPASSSGVNGAKAQFLTGLDNEGHVWLYVYSDSNKLPNGSPIFTLSFKDMKNIVAVNSQFRGIYVNASYPVPRELFSKFFSVVK